MASNEGSVTAQHKIRLMWPDGSHQDELLSDETTVEDIKAIAREKLDCSSSNIVLSTGRREKDEIETLTNDSRKAMSLFPHMSRVYCKESTPQKKKRPHSEMSQTTTATATTKVETTANDGWTCAVCTLINEKPTSVICEVCGTPKPASSAANPSERTQAIDLTAGDSYADDEAMARALQQQENDEAASRHSVQQQSLSAATSSTTATAHDDSSDGWFDASNLLLQASAELDPTTVTTVGQHWVYSNGPPPYRTEQVLGKWLVWCSERNVNKTWQTIWPNVVSGKLHAAGAKVLTKFGLDAGAHQHKSSSSVYVICVYTSQARMEEVAMNLIPLVRRDLHYKKDEDTALGVYSHNTQDRITVKSLYWNNGEPSFTHRKPKMKAQTSKAMALRAAKQSPPHPELTYSFEIVVALVGMVHCKLSRDEQLQLEEDVTRVVLKRDEENAYDSNAIGIFYDEKRIGFVQKAHAALLAPWLDNSLLRIESATMLYCRGDSTWDIKVTGKACIDAKDMLATL